MQWGYLNPEVAEAMSWPLITKDNVGVVTILANRVKAIFGIVLTYVDLWHWLVDHGVPSSELDRQATKFLLNLLNERVLGQVNSSLTVIIKTESHEPSVNSQSRASL